MKFSKKLLTWIGALVYSSLVSAVDIPLPQVNLGESSFEDGIAFPGVLVGVLAGYYQASQFNDSNGDKIPGENKISTKSTVIHVAYLSPKKLFGGYYGVEFLLPIVDVDVDTSFGPKGRKGGTGDLIVSPLILQWSDRKIFGLPFFQRFLLSVSVPTGDYKNSRSVNTGNNITTINPYYAFTILPNDKLEVSMRLHYLWNSKNTDPSIGLGVNSIQAGQAVHINYSTSYEFFKGVRLGVNGYALQQLNEDKVGGIEQNNSKERIFGIGPGAKLRSNNISLQLNGYYEFGAKNRTEGAKVLSKVTMVF